MAFIPYRFTKLARMAKEFISVSKVYKRDLDNNDISPSILARDYSDLLSLSLTDAGFTDKQQREIAAQLVKDIYSKYNLGDF